MKQSHTYPIGALLVLMPAFAWGDIIPFKLINGTGMPLIYSMGIRSNPPNNVMQKTAAPGSEITEQVDSQQYPQIWLQETHSKTAYLYEFTPGKDTKKIDVTALPTAKGIVVEPVEPIKPKSFFEKAKAKVGLAKKDANISAGEISLQRIVDVEKLESQQRAKKLALDAQKQREKLTPVSTPKNG